MSHLRFRKFNPVLLAIFLLAGCGGGGTPVALGQDVSAPGVFSVTDQGIWNGTEHLGGIWVTHPAATAPDRVVIRNANTGRETVGALYPGEASDSPAVRLSSDAARSLGIGANRRVPIQIVALRRPGEVGTEPVATPVAPEPAPVTAPAAPQLADLSTSAQAPTRSLRPAAAPLAERSALQIAVFANRGNADRAVQTLRARGVPAEIRNLRRGDRTYYSVVTPPIRTDAARARLLSRARASGFPDAFAAAP